MGDATGRRDCLHVVLLLQRLQAVPQPNTAAEQDWHLHDVEVVDETGGDERAHHGRPAADADVLTGGCVPRHLECIRRRGVEEVERRTTLHLQRRPRTVGQDVRRRVERRVVAPPAAPLRIVLPSGRAELARAHDLGTDRGAEPFGHGVIETLGAARLAEDLAASEARGHHPLVESMPGVAERGVEGLPLAGGEPVERDREVVDADARHGGSFEWWWSVRQIGGGIQVAPR